MIEALTLPAALAMGLAASGHCLAMCGGIAAAAGVVTLPGQSRRPPWTWLLATQLGRITSYSLAGLAVGGLLGGLITALDIEGLRTVFRLLTAVALLIAAAVLAGWLRDPGQWLGRGVWRVLAPLGRRFLPLRSAPAAFGFGMVWGWMPCGFVYSVLLVAAVAADPWRSASIMAAFGLGTLPAMVALAAGTSTLFSLAKRAGLRRLASLVLVATAVATVALPGLPGLAGHLPGHAGTVPGDTPAIGSRSSQEPEAVSGPGWLPGRGAVDLELCRSSALPGNGGLALPPAVSGHH